MNRTSEGAGTNFAFDLSTIMSDTSSPSTINLNRDRNIGLAIAAIILIVPLYLWLSTQPGSGFGPHVISTTTIEESVNGIKQTISTGQQEGKTLWDWLQLLIIPVVLIAGGYLLNHTDQERQQRESDSRSKREQEVAQDQLRENIFQDYLNQMSDLFEKWDLRDPVENLKPRAVATARTITVIRALDGRRNALLIGFLRDCGLMAPFGEAITLAEYDLSGVDLSGADLSGADLAKTNLTSSVLRHTYLAGVALNYAILADADFSYSRIEVVNCHDVMMQRSKFNRSHLRNVSFSISNLREADLSNANLYQARFGGSHLDAAVLRDLYAIDSYFAMSWLDEADFSKAQLYTCNFHRAHLKSVNFVGATLRECDLRSAELQGANFTDAHLTGCKLGNANLKGAVIHDSQLAEAHCLYYAKMPDGTLYDGRFNLEGDIERAREEGIDVNDVALMKRWYTGEVWEP